MGENRSAFETATTELRSKHAAGYLMDLGKVSSDYYWTEGEIDKLRQALAAVLPKEDSEKLNKMHDYFTARETIAGEIFYNQGFADGISLIMQSLMWQSVRR